MSEPAQAAGGTLYLIPTLLGAAPVDLGTWHAARQYFTGVRDRRQWVLFEPDLLPGYAWVFPLQGGRANVGFGVLRDGRSGTALRRLWSSVLTRTSMRDVLREAVPEGTPRAWPIPMVTFVNAPPS